MKPSLATVVFSCIGHLFVHLCTAFYFVIVLALEKEWRLPYHELIELWTLGALMVGVAALPAGLLGDRLGAPLMMVIFFLGMGLCSIAAGLAESSSQMLLCLAGVGVFASIYHPVGIPWLVRNAGEARGKALGFNGIFGSLGAASAGLTAGLLIDWINWRAAFIVPGVLCCATGVALWLAIAAGKVREVTAAPAATQHSGRRLARVFTILLVTMFMAGMIFNSTQTALPKVFALRHDGLIGGGAFGIGVLVAIVYTAAGIMQLIGGHLADRVPPKSVYVAAIFLQVPLLFAAAHLSGATLVLVATLMVVASVGALPAENILLAHYTPAGKHGLTFGLKFVLAFGAAPVAVQLVALIQATTGEFVWLFTTLSAFAITALLAALWLPGDQAPGSAQVANA